MEEKLSRREQLQRANLRKKDEFYTQIDTIENELQYYDEFFNDKVVYCNCDDFFESNFVNYFLKNFGRLNLKALFVSGKKKEDDEYALYWAVYKDDDHANVVYKGKEGDFREEEAIKFLKDCDIVVTNPPFSLFREHIAQILEHDKDFIVIGSINAISYKQFFINLQAGKIKFGKNINKSLKFAVPPHYEITKDIGTNEVGQSLVVVPGICWYTSFDISKHKTYDLELTKAYDPSKYKKYDYIDAINVDKTSDIPYDYDGLIGVPISAIDRLNPKDFEIIDRAGGRLAIDSLGVNEIIRKNKAHAASVNGKAKYARILIRKKQEKRG